MDAGARGPGRAPSRAPGPLGGGGRLALPAHWRTGAVAGGSAAAGRAGQQRAPLEIASDLLCGLDSGVWCGDGNPADAAPDQRAEDGRSLCFDSEPLDARLELLGNAQCPARARERPPAGPALRPAVRRGARRRVGSDHARGAQPHPLRFARAPAGARAGPALRDRRSTSTASPRRYRRGIGCDSRCRLPTGPGCGRRPNRSRSPCTARAAVCCSPSGRRAPRTQSCGRSRSPRARPACAQRRSIPTRARARCARDFAGGQTELTFRLGPGRALSPDGLRHRDRLLGHHRLLDRSRRPSVRAGALPLRQRVRPRRLDHASRDRHRDGRRRRALPHPHASSRPSRTAAR